MKKLNLISRILKILMLIIIIIVLVYVFLLFFSKKNNASYDITDKVDSYVLLSRDSDLYKSYFNDLKEVFESENIDYEKYATIISKLFIIDFYTLSNKNLNNDIGGIQYLKDELKENFILNAKNTIYKYINSGVEFPTVSNITCDKVESSTYEIDNVSYDAYLVNLKWNYEKDLGYDDEGTIVLIKDNNRLYIVEKK